MLSFDLADCRHWEFMIATPQTAAAAAAAADNYNQRFIGGDVADDDDDKVAYITFTASVGVAGPTSK